MRGSEGRAQCAAVNKARGLNAFVLARIVGSGGGARCYRSGLYKGRSVEGDEILQSRQSGVSAARLQEIGAALRGDRRGRSGHGQRVLLSREQLRPAVQAEQEGRQRERRAPDEGGAELSDGGREAHAIRQAR